MTIRGDYLEMVALYHAARRERDEARAVARQLAEALDRLLALSRHDEIEVLGSFWALPWAKPDDHS